MDQNLKFYEVTYEEKETHSYKVLAASVDDAASIVCKKSHPCLAKITVTKVEEIQPVSGIIIYS